MIGAVRRGILNRGLGTLYFVLSAVLGSLACGKVGDTTVIKLAHGLDVTHPVHRAMVRMGELERPLLFFLL